MTDLPNCYRCGCQPCVCPDGVTLLQGDCKSVMASLPEKHFQMCVTSPPYFALRSYLPVDHPDKPLEIGSETSIEAFVATMVAVFRGVWRVLRDDGVVFINLGDSYSAGTNSETSNRRDKAAVCVPDNKAIAGLPPKNLCNVPHRVVLALQADGWFHRDTIIWKKPSPMPGSQRDRCTSSYEFIFQLTKRPVYYWDMEAVREPHSEAGLKRAFCPSGRGHATEGSFHDHTEDLVQGQRNTIGPACHPSGRIPRNVLTIASEGYPDAHFATFPRALPEWCIKAATSEKGCCPECGAPWGRVTDSERVRTRPGENTKVMHEGDSAGGYIRKDSSVVGNRDPYRHITTTRTIGWIPGCDCYGDWTDTAVHANPEIVPCRILDPFSGASTTGLAAIGLQRHCTLIELASDYCDQSVKRLRDGLYAKATQREDLPGQQTLFDTH